MRSVFKATGFACTSAAFSPFESNLLAVSAAQHYGIVGNGRLFALAQRGPQSLEPVAVYDTQEALYDVCWSEQSSQHVIGACGDGSVKLWDLSTPERPIRAYAEHAKEVVGVHWNQVHKGTFASASWDSTIKVWSPESPRSMATFAEHQGLVYSATWSPYNPDMLASAGADTSVKIWDVKAPRSVLTIVGHINEVLHADWNKYNENVLASCSVDRTIRLWDIRSPQRELACLQGHGFAVRKCKWSPFSEAVLASVGYDLSMRLWDTAQKRQLEAYTAHTEFVVGVDWSLNVENQLATCSWDQTVHVFAPQSLFRP
eukprot:m51a1_g113 hypothetical protein (315) ;mRNA; f:348793-350000